MNRFCGSLIGILGLFVTGASSQENTALITVPEFESTLLRPIPFGQKRLELTVDYIRKHYDPEATTPTIRPQMIVVHWTGASTAASTFAAFHSETLPLWRWDVAKGGKLNVSAHFLVDRDGTIYQLMPTSIMARHVIGLNRVSIGIENVGGPKFLLTQQQVAANARLIQALTLKYPAIEYLIGHHEYLNFRNTPLWEEKDTKYVTAKQDPGPVFMDKLRTALEAKRLKSAYAR